VFREISNRRAMLARARGEGERPGVSRPVKTRHDLVPVVAEAGRAPARIQLRQLGLPGDGRPRPGHGAPDSSGPGISGSAAVTGIRDCAGALGRECPSAHEVRFYLATPRRWWSRRTGRNFLLRTIALGVPAGTRDCGSRCSGPRWHPVRVGQPRWRMSIYRQRGRLSASHERAITPFRFAVPQDSGSSAQRAEV
jgi:hypothetical protein